MKRPDSLFSSVKWIFYVSRRFSKVDRKGGSKVTSFLASLGICFGVMTLITVISIMNGFQMSFIDSIMEVSSYHLRVTGFELENSYEFASFCQNHNEIKTVTPFYEAQALMVGRNGSQGAGLIRAVPENIMAEDEGFRKEAVVWSGDFDLSKPDSIVLGSELARRLGLRTGSTVNLFALSGGNDVNLISNDRIFTVTGIIRTGYADINASYAFININDGIKYFGSGAKLIYGLKLNSTKSDNLVSYDIKKQFPESDVESWKSYNRSFFGTLKIEKNMLMLLVFIIFIVVGINIFNGMRRRVYERREEISILKAFGGSNGKIQSIFIMQGFLTGFKGAIPGLVLGLLLSMNMSEVFLMMSKIVYFIQLFMVKLTMPASAPFVRENSMYMIYANIPPRVFVNEVLIITIFGIFSSLLAAWAASSGVLKLTVAEVMRDE